MYPWFCAGPLLQKQNRQAREVFQAQLADVRPDTYSACRPACHQGTKCMLSSCPHAVLMSFICCCHPGMARMLNSCLHDVLVYLWLPSKCNLLRTVMPLVLPGPAYNMLKCVGWLFHSIHAEQLSALAVLYVPVLQCFYGVKALVYCCRT